MKSLQCDIVIIACCVLQVETVQRFVVVHGQILLNQFKHFPIKAIKNSAFSTTLQSEMELRRHAKLYSKTNKAHSRLRANSNPMRDRASQKARPMTATATTMVRSIWQSYFPASLPTAEGITPGRPQNSNLTGE